LKPPNDLIPGRNVVYIRQFGGSTIDTPVAISSLGIHEAWQKSQTRFIKGKTIAKSSHLLNRRPTLKEIATTGEFGKN
jgi:hypothetical protein